MTLRRGTALCQCLPLEQVAFARTDGLGGMCIARTGLGTPRPSQKMESCTCGATTGWEALAPQTVPHEGESTALAVWAVQRRLLRATRGCRVSTRADAGDVALCVTREPRTTADGAYSPELDARRRRRRTGETCRCACTRRDRTRPVVCLSQLVNGDINGNGLEQCNHTMREACPYWEVDLGCMNVIAEVKVEQWLANAACA